MTTLKNTAAYKLFSLLLMLVLIVSFAAAGVVSAYAEETVAQTQSSEPEVLTYGYFNYTIETRSNEEYVYITEYTGSGGDVSIPANINGIPVLVVGVEAFWYCDELTAVNLPDGLECVEAKAFQGCKNLQYVSMPDSVIEIGDAAFEGCEKLEDINIPADLLYIGGSAFDRTPYIGKYEGGSSIIIDSQHFYKYLGNASVVNIPEGIISISSDAFKYNQDITYVNIPDTVQFFGAFCFYNCPKLKSLSIPDDARYIADYAFGVDSIDKEGQAVLAENFVLYANEGTEAEDYCNKWGIERMDRKYNATPDELPEAESGTDNSDEIVISGKNEETQNVWVFIAIVAICTAVVAGLYIYFSVAEKKRKQAEKAKKNGNKKKSKKK